MEKLFAGFDFFLLLPCTLIIICVVIIVVVCVKFYNLNKLGEMNEGSIPFFDNMEEDMSISEKDDEEEGSSIEHIFEKRPRKKRFNLFK